MHGASIDRIAAEAGYTKGAFYAHFASKEDLFLTMLDEHFATELARLDAVLAGAEDPAEEARKAAEDFLEHIDADPEWRRALPGVRHPRRPPRRLPRRVRRAPARAARADGGRVRALGLAISASPRPSRRRRSPR